MIFHEEKGGRAGSLRQKFPETLLKRVKQNKNHPQRTLIKP